MTSMSSREMGAMNLGADGKPTPRAWIVLAILVVFYLFSFLDKQMYALLINSIGQNLRLTDFQLGKIQGIAFSVAYTLGVLFIGWLADRYSRRMLLLFGLIFWSLADAAGGLAHGYNGLFAARACVGLGEAVLIPTAMSLLATTFPRASLGLATGLFMAGSNLGGVVALLFGGGVIAALSATGVTDWPILGVLQPWQAAFVITGLPGVLMALLAFGLPREARPARAAASVGEAGLSTRLIPYMRTHKAFLAAVIVGTSLMTMLAYTLIIWSPAYFERQYHWGHAKIGVVMAIGIATGGVGNIFWGWFADRMRRRGRRDGLFRLYIVLTLIGLPIGVITFVTRDATLATIGYPLTWFVLNSFGPLTSALQFGIPDALRGRLVGLLTTVTGLVGFSAGPLLVGAITDFVYRDKAMIGHSIAISLVLSGLAAVLVMLLGLRAYGAAIEEQERAAGAAPAQTPPLTASAVEVQAGWAAS
jgi:MFS family permease